MAVVAYFLYLLFLLPSVSAILTNMFSIATFRFRSLITPREREREQENCTFCVCIWQIEHFVQTVDLF